MVSKSRYSITCYVICLSMCLLECALLANVVSDITRPWSLGLDKGRSCYIHVVQLPGAMMFAPPVLARSSPSVHIYMGFPLCTFSIQPKRWSKC